jgi:hypothetical protein
MPTEVGDFFCADGAAGLARRWRPVANVQNRHSPLSLSLSLSLSSTYKSNRPTEASCFPQLFLRLEVSRRLQPTLANSSCLDNPLNRAVVLPQESPSSTTSFVLHIESREHRLPPTVSSSPSCFSSSTKCPNHLLMSPSCPLQQESSISDPSVLSRRAPPCRRWVSAALTTPPVRTPFPAVLSGSWCRAARVEPRRSFLFSRFQEFTNI